MNAAVALFVGCFLVLETGILGQLYDNRYDNINVDTILKNDRVLDNYIKCLLEKGPCTREGRMLKKDLPDAINTHCDKCTEKQKQIVRKASVHVRTRRPADWKALLDKYDPNAARIGEFEKFLNET